MFGSEDHLRVKAFLRDLAVALRSGTSSAHFENLCIRTSSIWLPVRPW